MKTHTFSVVVGTAACNAKCPFCVSKMTCRASEHREVNWSRFEKACQIVDQARDGLVNVLLTGTGEPTMSPIDIHNHLGAMDGRFPLVTLQTNGILLDRVALKEWRDQGLTQVCLSITSTEPERSNEIMGIGKWFGFNYWERVEMLHDLGLSVRLNCTMLNEGISTPVEIGQLIELCQERGVEQLTLREVDKPDCPAAAPEVARYVEREKPNGAAEKLFHYLLLAGANRLPDLPHGGSVFDCDGQNVCISNCLTDTLDPNDIRQIIFFPTGEISYDWKYKGARIL
jgi:molybdenum cofactor biosynthesis enzyme MoaA